MKTVKSRGCCGHCATAAGMDSETAHSMTV